MTALQPTTSHKTARMPVIEPVPETLPAGPGIGGAKLPRGVRVIEARHDGAYVVEVEAPRADNPLVKAYRALSAIGVRLVHTEVRVATDSLVQRLHLLEPDDSPLSRRRLLAALGVLATLCHTTVAGSFAVG